MNARSARVAVAVVLGATLALSASGVSATTSTNYQATYVEPVGGPNGSPFSCPPGTSCGWASMSGLGHADAQIVQFNYFAIGVHLRTLYFTDGSTLLIKVTDQPGPFAFSSPGNSGQGGYIGFPGLAGNPQFLRVDEEIIGGTGRLEGATGSGSGTVRLHGGVAVGHTSGTITLP